MSSKGPGPSYSIHRSRNAAIRELKEYGVAGGTSKVGMVLVGSGKKDAVSHSVPPLVWTVWIMEDDDRIAQFRVADASFPEVSRAVTLMMKVPVASAGIRRE